MALIQLVSEVRLSDFRGRGRGSGEASCSCSKLREKCKVRVSSGELERWDPRSDNSSLIALRLDHSEHEVYLSKAVSMIH